MKRLHGVKVKEGAKLAVLCIDLKSGIELANSV